MNALAAYSDFVLRELQLEVKELKPASAEADSLAEVLPDPVYSSPVLTCHAILLRPRSCNAPPAAAGDSNGAANGEAPDEAPPAKRQRNTCETPSAVPAPGSGDQGVSASDGTAAATPPREQQPAVCYVCKLSSKRGKFLPAKAKELGVKPGPDFGKLTNGETIVSATTQLPVTPEMCMEDGTAGEVVVVVDCPSAAHMPALQAALPALRALMGDAAGQRVKAVVHITAEAAAAAPEYRAWMAALPDCQHLMCGCSFDAARHAPSLRASHQLQAKLHMLCPQLFALPSALANIGALPPRLQDCHVAQGQPVPATAPTPAAPDVSAGEDAAAAKPVSTPVAPGQGGERSMCNLSRLVLRPLRQRGLNDSEVQRPLRLADVLLQLQQEAPKAVALALELMEQTATGAAAAAVSPAQFRAVFLGTGAACPSKYRNVTAIYLDFFDHGGMLVDCGEGTLGQLRRRFGHKDAQRRLRGLRCVWISHRHADHHVGLPAVLAERARLLGPAAQRIPLFGPFSLRRVVSACDKIEPLCYQWIDQYCICPRAQGAGRDLGFFWDNAASFDATPYVRDVCKALGLSSMESVLVEHCKHSFGLVLRSEEGWSFAFSGDTQRCDNLISAAQGATVLVHEATFDNDKADDARHKRHSTIADAMEVGRATGCKCLVLTHFSQRYPKVPVLGEVGSGMTAIAFDMMTLDLRHLGLAPAVLPLLQELFPAEDKAGAVEDEARQQCVEV